MTPDSPAASIGLQPGDRIVGLDGSPVAKSKDLITAILAANASVKLSILRRGRKAGKRAADASRAAVPRGHRLARRHWGTGQRASLPSCARHARRTGWSAGGDRINQVSGQSFRDSNEFQRLVTEAGGSLELLIEREGRQSVVVLAIGSQTPTMAPLQ